MWDQQAQEKNLLELNACSSCIHQDSLLWDENLQKLGPIVSSDWKENARTLCRFVTAIYSYDLAFIYFEVFNCSFRWVDGYKKFSYYGELSASLILMGAPTYSSIPFTSTTVHTLWKWILWQCRVLKSAERNSIRMYLATFNPAVKLAPPEHVQISSSCRLADYWHMNHSKTVQPSFTKWIITLNEHLRKLIPSL